ncbi:MAG TPA: RNA repair transcriptional activator RtcR family protein [Ignavibacteria bacterium]
MKKAYNILISFVGGNDAGKMQGKNDGAILTLLKAGKFDELNLIWTKSEKEKFDSYKIAKYLEKEIKARKHCLSVYLHPFELEDVTDHNEIYPKLLELCRDKFENRLKTIKLTAAISSGTPSMQVCWILMAESGDFPLEIIRVSEPKFKSKPFTQVKLGTGLPRIVHLEKEIKALKPEIVMTIKHPSLKIDNNEIILGPLEFCYYRYFLTKAISGEKYMKVYLYELPMEFLECIISYYIESFSHLDQDIGQYKKMFEKKENISAARFLPNRSKINRKIKEALNNPSRSRYAEIESEGIKSAKKYGINLPKEKIKILK